jgi:hypothetical protein
MTSKKRLVISLVVTALALAGLWFWHFYFIMCCAPPAPRCLLPQHRNCRRAHSLIRRH